MQRESADFPGASCDKTKTARTDVGDGTWTAGPWNGEQNNDGKKAKINERNVFVLLKHLYCKEYAEYAEYAEYVNKYASIYTDKYAKYAKFVK